MSDAKRRIYSQSEINTFLKCGKQWEFRYVMGLKTAPRAALTLGKSVDRGVTANLIEKIKTGNLLPLEAVLDAYSSEFDRSKPETEWGEDDAGQQKDMGVKLVTLHHEQIAPKIEPAAVQENFEIETDQGYSLTGTLDVLEKNLTVVDTKTSKKAYSETAVEEEIQPALYDFAVEALSGKPSPGFRFDVLIKTKVPRVQQVSGKVSPQAREFLFESINQMHKAVEAGVTLPAPAGAWWCSKEWCGYWSRCKGKKG